MFWWNLFLFGVLLVFVISVLWRTEYENTTRFLAIITALYEIAYFVLGAMFLSSNSLKNMLRGESTEPFMKAFTHNQMMINSLTPELQEYFGVEEQFSILAIVINVIIVAAITYFIYLRCSDNADIYPYQSDYQSFNSKGCYEKDVWYKFKVFEKVFYSLILAERNPFIAADENNLRYKDWETGTVYRIHFSYFDYLRYRHFLKRRNSEKSILGKKNQELDAANMVLAFNEVLKRDLEAEGRRPWKDLMKE